MNRSERTWHDQVRAKWGKRGNPNPKHIALPGSQPFPRPASVTISCAFCPYSTKLMGEFQEHLAKHLEEVKAPC